MSTPLDPMRQYLGSQGITPGQQAGGPGGPSPAGPERTAEGKTFSDVLKDFVDQVDGAQKHFDQAIEAVERGETDNLHQVMLAQNQAQVSLKLAAEVRDKLVEAYKEVMRTQI
ncbi:MAG: flagellar hook-basal body complex protein FliE [Planctomycetota bacterium]